MTPAVVQRKTFERRKGRSVDFLIGFVCFLCIFILMLFLLLLLFSSSLVFSFFFIYFLSSFLKFKFLKFSVDGAIDCFKCVSINGDNPACDDPFHNNYTAEIYESPCMGGRKDRNGLFPATACIKMAGQYRE